MGRVISCCQVLSLLLMFFHFQVDCSSHAARFCLPDERAFLLEFKSSISVHDDGNYCSYPRTNSWNESKDCCLWEGVSCHQVTGHVIGIDLSESCLYGNLPTNSSLFNLQKLQWLDLSFNQLNGSLAANSTLFLLQGLQRLSLAYNHFNGSISSTLFSQLVSLTHLNLSTSHLSGLIPSDISLLSKLVSLDLSKNFELTLDSHGLDMLALNLTELRSLFLDGVDMSGVQPNSLLNLTSSLQHLNLSSCHLQGEFPSEVFSFPNLEYLDLSGNSAVTGYLPQTNWSSPLKLLELSNCGFRGFIPASLGNLTQITSLNFFGNKFGGHIPNCFGSLKNLTGSLVFSSCNFSGPLPSTVFNLTRLEQLDFSDNQLEGPLPKLVDGLQSLRDFSFSNNLISGKLPSWLFTLPSLQVLNLGYNQITGPIPEVERPNSLQHVFLMHNNLYGSIPSSFFHLADLIELDLSSNNLSGIVRSDMLSKLKHLRKLDVSNNSLLSLSSNGSDDGNHTFDALETISFFSCNVKRFPNFLRTAKSLKFLDLSYNQIKGSISKWEAEGWEQLTNFNISNNLLTGFEQYPGKNLEILDICANLLQNNLPTPPASIRTYLVARNLLKGKVPPVICNFTSLEILDLSKNSLDGIIPACLGNFSRSLTVMNLQSNNLHGEIPGSFCNEATTLRNLALNDNQLEGLLPQSLINCTFLEVVNMANKKLSDTFPHWLGVLPELRVLILRFNRFRGSMPNFVVTESSFRKLQVIDISHNQFSGPLPAKFFQNLKAMIVVPKDGYDNPYTYVADGNNKYFVDQYTANVTMKRLEIKLVKMLAIFTGIDFSSNRFDGRIPGELGKLHSLQVLNLSHNNLIGPIPPSLGNLVALESLDLSSNKLSGRIPPQLTNMTFLEVLNLSQNILEGPIPHGKQFDTFENDSYSGNLGLCGFPLSKQCGNDERPMPQPMFKEDEGLLRIAFIWKLAMMGYGCGVVLGLSTGYIVFTIGRPWWLVRMIERIGQKTVTRWIHRNRGRRN